MAPLIQSVSPADMYVGGLLGSGAFLSVHVWLHTQTLVTEQLQNRTRVTLRRRAGDEATMGSGIALIHCQIGD
jgi:hypothetical protein